MVVQSPRLIKGDGLVRKRIGTGEVLDVIEPVIRVNRQHRRRAKDMNEAGRDVDGINQLPLVLARRLLIKFIGRLEPVAREKQIQVKRVLRVWTVVDAI